MYDISIIDIVLLILIIILGFIVFKTKKGTIKIKYDSESNSTSWEDSKGNNINTQINKNK